MKCILLTGGNAAGKTAVFRAAKERHVHRPGWQWIDGDRVNGKSPDQFKALNRVWVDPSVIGIAIEGVRIYNAVFRCAAFSRVKRQLWVGLLLQEYEVGRHHIEQRCARSGKRYRAEFWDRGGAEVGHLLKDRYLGGVAKFLREHGARAGVAEIREFYIDRDYTVLAAVGQWLDSVIGGPV